MDAWCRTSIGLTIGGDWPSTFGMESTFKSRLDGDASTTSNAMSTNAVLL